MNSFSIPSNKLTIAVFLLVWISSPTYSQTSQYEIDLTQTASFTVTGTSSLTDWAVTVNTIGADPVMLGGLVPGQRVENFYFFASIEDMDGGRGEAMNDKIKKTLKSDEHPRVEYRQTEPAAIRLNGETSYIKIFSTGDLTVGGVTRSVALELEGHKQENGEIQLKDQRNLTFSEFDMEPPSALFGQIICGDSIQVNIVLNLKLITQN